MKQISLEHIPESQALDYTIQQYNQDIESLKKQIQAANENLDEACNRQLENEDRFEVSLEKVSYYTLILELQQQMLAKALQLEQIQPIDAAFLSDVTSPNYEQLEGLKQYVAQLRQRCYAQIGEYTSEQPKTKEFLQEIENRKLRLMDQEYSFNGVLNQQIEQVLGIQLANLADNQPLRRQIAGEVNKTAREQAQQSSHEVADKNTLYKSLKSRIVSVKNLRSDVDYLAIIRELREELPQNQCEQPIEVPEIWAQILSYQQGGITTLENRIDMGQMIGAIRQLREVSFPQSIIRQYQENVRQVDEEQLRLANDKIEQSVQIYEGFVDLLQKSITSEECACDCVEQSDSFQCPELLQFAPRDVKMVEIQRPIEFRGICDQMLSIVENAQKDYEKYISMLNTQNRELYSSNNGEICRQYQKFILYIEKICSVLQQNCTDVEKQNSESALLLQNRQNAFANMSKLGNNEVTQIFLDMKRNFCQICKNSNANTILPCGHMFCKKCIEGKSARQMHCLYCTQQYREDQVVKLAKTIIM